MQGKPLQAGPCTLQCRSSLAQGGEWDCALWACRSLSVLLSGRIAPGIHRQSARAYWSGSADVSHTKLRSAAHHTCEAKQAGARIPLQAQQDSQHRRLTLPVQCNTTTHCSRHTPTVGPCLQVSLGISFGIGCFGTFSDCPQRPRGSRSSSMLPQCRRARSSPLQLWVPPRVTQSPSLSGGVLACVVLHNRSLVVPRSMVKSRI